MFHFCGRPTWSYTLQDLNKGLPSNLPMFHFPWGRGCHGSSAFIGQKRRYIPLFLDGEFFRRRVLYWQCLIIFSTTILSEGCIELGVKGPSPNWCRPSERLLVLGVQTRWPGLCMGVEAGKKGPECNCEASWHKNGFECQALKSPRAGTNHIIS